MAGIKFIGFRGIAPKFAPELIADQAAQIANNCKLFSGDIVPYPQPVIKGLTGRTGDTGTIHPLRDPNTNQIVWLSWPNEVDVATPSAEVDSDEQRFYYTGDGVPKVSNYQLATSGAAPYPVDYYQLGLPLPETKLTATAVNFAEVAVSSVSRDSTGYVTIVTATDHNLRTGNIVSISGFTHYAAAYSRSGNTITVTLTGHGISNGSTVFLNRTSGGMTDGGYTVFNSAANTFQVTEPESGSTSGNLKIDTRSYNTVGSEVTVINSTTFTYFAPGFQQTTYSVTGAKAILSGTPVSRQYTYTWYTPWGEESVGSDPSDFIITKEGQTVTVTGLPTAPPTEPAKNFIRGIRLYRTVSGETDADFFLLKTLWFPQLIAKVSRYYNTADANYYSRVTTVYPHNFIEDDRFKIANSAVPSFDITGGVVKNIVDRYTFEYIQGSSVVAETDDLVGALYHDAAESNDEPAFYWGDTTYTFTDSFNARYLNTVLESDDYNPPPSDLRGLKTIQNNILCGFVGNRLFFSEPNKPHAWPSDYEKVVDFDIVAVEPISSVGAIVLTKGYPYLVDGSDPAVLTIRRIDALYPCVSSKGVVSMSYGIVYPTYEGLAVYSPTSGPRLVTGALYEQDSWSLSFDPTTVVATYYNDSYLASHSTGGFVFQFDQQTGGIFVDIDQTFVAAHADSLNTRVFFVTDNTGNVYEWDDLTQPSQIAEWKSKVLVTKDYVNLGAARIIADYGTTLPAWDLWDINWENNTTTTWGEATNLTFNLWANKSLVFSTTVTSGQTFRLPTGYRTDTYEVGVVTPVRVRSIHLAETPLGLKEI